MKRLILLAGISLLAGLAPAQTPAAERTLGKDGEFRITLPATPYVYEVPQLARGQRGSGQRGPGRSQDNTPSNNAITNAGATLGRVLFYDKRLSITKTVACATCHQQKHAFAEPTRVSTGIHSRKGKRNSPSLVNVRYHRSGRFFWDERAESLEEQVLMPIQDQLEMGFELPDLVDRLGGLYEYSVLFHDAFDDPEVTEEGIARALAQFVRSMTSFESRFDRGLAKAESVDVAFADFTDEESLGKRLFFEGSGRGASCASCHGSRGRGRGRGRDQRPGTSRQLGDVLASSTPRNIGLDRKTGDDRGMGAVSGRENDDGKFKAPSLRNVEVSAPYMHDGRFATLEEVVEHYSNGVKDHPNLDRRLAGRRGRGGRGRIGGRSSSRGMNLSSRERKALVAFLKTLTDREFLTDPRFSSPFRSK